MKMNASTDYAIRMLIYLAEKDGIVSSTVISRHLLISKRYLHLIGSKLRDADLIKVTHGSGGGYQLITNPSEITLYDIIMLMEGTTFFVSSVTLLGEEKPKNNSLNSIYQLLQSLLSELLSEISLDTIIRKIPEENRHFVLERFTQHLFTLL